MDSLEALERNLQVLVSRYEALEEENRQLRSTNENQRQELMRSHAELVEMQQQCTRLKTANAIVGDPESREAARRRIAQLIGKVDKAMEVLKQ